MKSQQSANMYQSFDAVACYCGQGKQERMADDDLTALYFLQHPTGQQDNFPSEWFCHSSVGKPQILSFPSLLILTLTSVLGLS